MPRGVESSLLVKAQANKGEDATFDGSEYPMPLLSESMQARPNIYTSEAIRNRAMKSKALARQGTLDVAGGVELEATNWALSALLPLIFPDAAATPSFGDADNFSVVYKPSTTDEQDYFTMAVNDGEVTRYFRDCRVNSFGLQANIDQLARMSLDTPGIRADVAVESLSGTTPDNEYGLYFEQASVLFGDADSVLAEVDAQTVNLNFARNINTNRYKLGSRFKRSLPGGLFDITGSLTIDANPFASDKDKLYTAVLNSEWLALRLEFVDPINEVDSDGSGTMVSSKLVVDIPYLLIEWPSHNISGPDFIEGPVNFSAFADVDAELPSITHVYSL